MNSATASSSAPRPHTPTDPPPTEDSDCEIIEPTFQESAPNRRSNRRRRRTPYQRNSVYDDIMHTISEAQSRKRRREEAMFNRRDVGQQTTCEFGYDVDTRDELGRDGISATKRIKREVNPSLHDPEVVTTQSVSTNTSSPPPFNFVAPFSVAAAAAASATSINNPTNGFPFRASVFPGGPVTPEATRYAARLAARRVQRSRRPYADLPRLPTDQPTSILQQINGMVPASEHNCQLHCHFPNHAHSMSTAQHSVSPAIAPAAMASIRGNIAPPAFSYPAAYPLNIPASAMSVPLVMGVMVPMAVPPAIPSAPSAFHNVYSLRTAGLPPPAMLSHPSTLDYFSNFLRNQELFYPTMARNGVDRHYMFAGLDIDVPVGATRLEIDNYTTSETYQKPEKEDEEGTCTVCLSGYEQGETIRKLPCNHFFHPECIEKWLDINKRCPMCREEIDGKFNAAQ